MLIRNTRRDIARVKTVLAERVRAAAARTPRGCGERRYVDRGPGAEGNDDQAPPKNKTPNRRPNVPGTRFTSAA